MVGRITKGRKVRGALEYNARKVAQGKAVVLFGNKVLGECGYSEQFDLHRALKSFQPYLDADHGVADVVFHASLNPDGRDNLCDEQLTAIAQEYMERMGFAEQPYYVFKHRDIQREHIHIVSVRIRDDGTAISDSNNFRHSKAILRDVEQKYGLHPAREGEQCKVFDTIKKVEYGSQNLTQQLRSVVRQLAQEYRFGSLSEFRTLLNLYNVDLEQRRGEAAGRPYEGIVYSATDERGQWQGRPIKASALTPKGGHKFLQGQIDKNMPKIKDENLKRPIRASVARAMHRARTQAEFVELLKAEGIDAVLRQNAEGRITGSTFIDHRNKIVLNGSRLGKSYSANVFQELFNNPRADRAALLPKLRQPASSTPRPTLRTAATTPEPRRRSAAGIPSEAPGLPPQTRAHTFAGGLSAVAGNLFGQLIDGGMSDEEFQALREELSQRRKRRRKRSIPR